MSWAQVAQDILDAMNGSGVSVDRSVITAGPEGGIRCRTFLVYLESPQALPSAIGRLGTNGECTVVPTMLFQARFGVDCIPTPGDNGEQPPAAETTAKTLEFLGEAQQVWNSIADAAPSWGCRAVSIGAGIFTGPSGGVATMTVPVLVQDDGLPALY